MPVKKNKLLNNAKRQNRAANDKYKRVFPEVNIRSIKDGLSGLILDVERLADLSSLTAAR